MFFLNRGLTRTTGTSIAPSGRPVQTIPSFDTSLPALFPDPDVAGATADILSQLQMLTAKNAVDGAHAAVLDALIAEVTAPFYKAATEHLSTALRIIQQLDQQAIEVATTAYERGMKASDEAEQAEKEADEVYKTHVGIARIRSTYREATNWEQLKSKLQEHKLTLTSDPGVFGLLGRSFRGGDRDDAGPLDSSEPVSEPVAALPLALLHPDNQTALVN